MHIPPNPTGKKSMSWTFFVAGAVLSWGIYGSMLADGQMRLGSPLRALLCVGVAYFLVGVLVPVGALSQQPGGLAAGFNTSGATAATIAGMLGAAGAACIIWAFRSGGSPLYVMPLVFGGAPVINVIYTMIVNTPTTPPSMMWFLGLIFASIGAGMVLYFRPPAA